MAEPTDSGEGKQASMERLWQNAEAPERAAGEPSLLVDVALSSACAR